MVGSDEPQAQAFSIGDPRTETTSSAGANEPKRRQRPRGDSPEDAEDARPPCGGMGNHPNPRRAGVADSEQ